MIVIEFMGTPRSGKTTQIAKLKTDECVVIEDRLIEKEIKVPLDEAFEYNLQFFNKVYEKLLEAKHSGVKRVFLDRGFYDAIAWFLVEHKRGNISNKNLIHMKQYFSHLQDYVHKVVFMNVMPKTTFLRDETSGAEVTDCTEYAFNQEYISDLYEVYMTLEKEHKGKENVLILDGSKTIEETNELIKLFLK